MTTLPSWLPFWEHQGIAQRSRTFFRESSRATVISMNTATPFPWSGVSAEDNSRTAFRTIFEHAPVAVARCNPEGVIVEMNPAFRRSVHQTVDHNGANGRSLRLRELVRAEDRDKTETLLRELLVEESLGPSERVLYDLLTVDEARPIDDLVECSGLSSSEVLATLFDLELKGIVRQLPGKQFLKVLL